MKLIIVGCEYSGTTTLANLVCDWAAKEMGVKLVTHDHWKIPDIGCYPHLDSASPLTDLESKEILALSPKFKEMLQRQSTIMHLPTEDQGEDYLAPACGNACTIHVLPSSSTLELPIIDRDGSNVLITPQPSE